MKKIEIFERASKREEALRITESMQRCLQHTETLNTQETKTSILRIPSGIMTLQRSQRP